MGKRGRKLGDPYNGASLKFSEIAKRLGCSTRTVTSDYKKAINKLRGQRGALEGLLLCVHAVAVRDREIMRCGSAECNPEWIAEHADGGESEE